MILVACFLISTIIVCTIIAGIIFFLNKIKLKNLKTNTTVEYTLVAETESNLKEGKLSVGTPIAKALMGKKVGDIVDVQIPSGTVQFQIVEISR